jgi:hypothetical protein
MRHDLASITLNVDLFVVTFEPIELASHLNLKPSSGDLIFLREVRQIRTEVDKAFAFATDFNFVSSRRHGNAALTKDLKQRGLSEDTLVIWSAEFGRASTSEGRMSRDHDHYGFTAWMAGGGVMGGLSCGSTDELGLTAVEDRVHVHDLHATILQLLGLNLKRLTYGNSGRDYRLTDVHGKVVSDVIA